MRERKSTTFLTPRRVTESLTDWNVLQGQVELDAVANDDVTGVLFLDLRIRETVDQLHEARRDPNELGIEIDLDEDADVQRFALLEFSTHIRHVGRSCGLFERHDDLLVGKRITVVVRHAARVSVRFLELIRVRTGHEELFIFMLAPFGAETDVLREQALVVAQTVIFLFRTCARVELAVAELGRAWVDVWISVVAVGLVWVEPLRSRACEVWISCAAVAVAVIVEVKREERAIVGLPVAVFIDVVACLDRTGMNLLPVRVRIRIVIAVGVRGGCTNGHVTCFDLLPRIAVAIAIVVLEVDLLDFVAVVDELVAIVVDVVADFRIAREHLRAILRRVVVAVVLRDDNSLRRRASLLRLCGIATTIEIEICVERRFDILVGVAIAVAVDAVAVFFYTRVNGKSIFHTVLVLICTRVVAIVADRYVVLREALACTRQFTCGIAMAIAVAIVVPGLRRVIDQLVAVVVDVVAELRRARANAESVVVAVVHVRDIARSGLVSFADCVHDRRIAGAILVPITVHRHLDACLGLNTFELARIGIVTVHMSGRKSFTTSDGKRHREAQKALLHRGLLENVY